MGQYSKISDQSKRDYQMGAGAQEKTLRDLIDGFAKFGAKPALVQFKRNSSETISFAELADQIKTTAARLNSAGIGKASRLVLFAPNSVSWIVCALAGIYAGATIVPVDSQQSDEVLEHILKDSGASLIFTDSRGSKRLNILLSESNDLKLMSLFLDSEEGEGSWKNFGAESITDQGEGESNDVPISSLSASDIAVIFYTSGTTGMPKGVPLSHANMQLQLDSIGKMKLLKRSDRILAPLPLFHVYPLNIGLLVPLSMALPVILPSSLTGPEIVRAIKEGKVTVLVGVPRLLRSLYQSIEGRLNKNKLLSAAFFGSSRVCEVFDRALNLQPGRILFAPIRNEIGSTLRLFTCGGAPLESELARKIRALGWEIALGYGLSETAPLLTLRMPHDRDLDGVGKPIIGVEVTIDKHKGGGDETEKDAGEILARGVNVFSGYLNRPDLNKEAFTEDGWFRTGDLGVIKNEHLHVSGRASSTIVMEGGEKIQPENVEDKISKHPGISEIGLLQVEHKLVALVVPDKKAIGGEDVRQYIAHAIKEASAGMASYLQITDFRIASEALPRTNLGKIKRFELKKLYERAQGDGEQDGTKNSGAGAAALESGDQALLEDPAASACWKWLQERFPDQKITLDTSPQLDLNIDSMEWLNLTLEIMEKTGVELSGEAIGRVQTVRDLLNEIISSGSNGEGAVSPLEDPGHYLNDQQKEFLKPLSLTQRVGAREGYLAILGFMKPFHVRAVGLERLSDNQYVFTPNHASYIDAFAIAAALPYERLVNTQWAGWSGIAFGNPIFSFLSRLARVFPIEAKQSLFASLALGVSVLKQGSNLVWFPEGERTLDGKLLPFKKGIGMLLENRDIRVVPVYLDGTREALPPGAFFPTFHQINVIFGEPVKAEQLAKEGEGSDASERIARALQARVADLARSAKHSNSR